MKKSELKSIIKEEADQWTGRDLIDTAQALVLAKKSILGAIRNLEKLEKQMVKHKNKTHGEVLYRMLPVMKLSAQLAKINKLDDAMGTVFAQAWDKVNNR